MKKILITGSEGFIGSNLRPALAKAGYSVYSMDSKSGQDIIGPFYPEETMDLIVHLAAQTSTKKSVEDPSMDFWNNALGTVRVLEQARKWGCGIIYAGTRKSQVVLPSPYGLSKHVGAEYVRLYQREYGVPYIIDIIGNVYGPDQEGSPDSFWLDHLIKCHVEDKEFTIYGFDGEQSRDMLYIDDMVSLLVKQVQRFKDSQGIYQVGGGVKNELSINQALKYLNHKKVAFGPMLSGDKKHAVVSNSAMERLKQVFDWEPTVPWKEGIDKMLEHYAV